MEDGGIFFDECDKFASTWWKDLRKKCGGENEDRWGESMREWKIGGGHLIRFWEDCWMREINLAS